ncbi:hypothetical protein ACFLVX_01040 [Chloroflexota bacterium]
MEKWRSPDIHKQLCEMTHEVRELGRLIGHQAHWANPEKLDRILETISCAYKNIDIILGQEK